MTINSAMEHVMVADVAVPVGLVWFSDLATTRWRWDEERGTPGTRHDVAATVSPASIRLRLTGSSVWLFSPRC
jgi:hypothetical protein